jgi:hypothetical protein
MTFLQEIGRSVRASLVCERETGIALEASEPLGDKSLAQAPGAFSLGVCVRFSIFVRDERGSSLHERGKRGENGDEQVGHAMR